MPDKNADPGVGTEIHGAVRVIRIDRPAARNALNPALLDALAEAFDAAGRDSALRAIVITGGTEVFSAGADIDALGGHTAATYPGSVNRRAFDAIRATPLPVVAAVAGYCLGGGCEIALGCDLIVAGDTAIFGQPEINIGIIPGAGGTQLWAPRTGAGAQAEAALTARTVDAWEARRIGLVDRVVPSAHVIDAALHLAHEIATKAPLAARAAKKAMRAPWSAPLGASLDAEVQIMSGLLASADAHEGVAAFLEKRRPRFEGR
ncbi:enoyl-CoA hydratase/isomerase family protein [Limibaculum sp. M0105]|uniref:Enoyl-CoA hydratase/isomerase family protein n=1 Tax=Thermohalobaculum xanthum TaxID=2753746 RepID=A0A8J7M651_9RHOB|nr:enoyl-CoA hydratase-related protein [Thermohalobaculum xanthum]MBK0398199.1 enoyl-CoA hydratase/isomerase family protein [Thermohalobaculum xanthum]